MDHEATQQCPALWDLNVQSTSGILRVLQAFSWLQVYTAPKPSLIPPNCGNASLTGK